MRLRLTTNPPHDPRDLVPFARAVDDLGLDGIGVADSPQLHGATFPAVQHLLSVTSRISVGTFVTNPLTRHPSVQAADAEALDLLYPGRFFLGIGTGDSSVRSVGLPAARAADVAACIDVVQARVGDRVPTLFAVGGPKAAATVPSSATGIIIGGGLDAGWSGRLVALAEESAGHPLQRWGFLVGSLGPADQADARRREVLGSVATVSRHALARDMAGRGAPAELIAGLRTIYDGYDVQAHGALDGANHRLLDSLPEHRDYLLDRFAVTDAAPDTVRRLTAYAAELDLTGLFLSSTVSDRLLHAHHIATDLAPALP